MEYGGRGFRSSLDEALGAWREGKPGYDYYENDYSENMAVVDYSTFKMKLRKYSQRRTKLRRLMERNHSNSLISDEVMPILHFPEDKLSQRSEGRRRRLSSASSPVDCYMPMNLEDGGLPGVWEKPIQVLHRMEIMREVSGLERDGIADFIADETSRISEAYRSRTQFVARRFLEWRTNMWNGRHEKPRRRSNSIDEENNDAFELEDDLSNDSKIMIEETLTLGRALLDLEAFCVLNILIVRQTLLRYDAFARSFEGTPMMEFYLKSVLRSTSPHDGRSTTPNLYHYELRQIFIHEEVNALCLNFAHHLDRLCRYHKVTEKQNEGSDDDIRSNETNTNWNGMVPLLHSVADRFKKDREELQRLVLSSADDKTVVLSNDTHPVSPTTTVTEFFSGIVAKYFFLGMYMEDQFGWYLDGTLTRGRSLTEEMKSLTEWKRKSDRMWFVMNPNTNIQRVESIVDGNTCGVGQALLEGLECEGIAQCGSKDAIYAANEKKKNADDDDSLTDAGALEANEVAKQQKFNLFMALTAGFLYCMNYYIVEPSSTMYVNALGAHDAAGATLIGMMPIASFMSAIAYSIWTNSVFRQPFLVSCSLMVTGNIIYSSAFNYKSLPMAMIGRFLTGLGGPKMIVRRYMADTTSVSIRTSVNAGFGMVVAAGSALGPGCAILLSNFSFIIPLPGGSELWFNSMTGPGWFMATLWTFFSIALFLGFREQERIGLAEKLEQDKMEKQEEIIQTEQENDASTFSRIEEGTIGNNSTNTHRIRGGIPEDDLAPGTYSNGKGDQRPMNAHWAGERSLPSVTKHEEMIPTPYGVAQPKSRHSKQSVSVEDESTRTILSMKSSMSMMSESYNEKALIRADAKEISKKASKSLWAEIKNVSRHLYFPVQICMGLLFAKVFVIETLVSCTSVLSKNRYGWNIHQVGLLGCANGFFVIPLSIMVGKLSLHYQDRYLMVWLLAVGTVGLCLLVDVTDLIDTSEAPQTYNKYKTWSVGPIRYVIGYFVTYLSIQSFEGIIGSALSKLIPTALAKGTFNSGLLATLVDTFGRSCGDLFISLMGFWNIRQLMNLLFIPGVTILVTCWVVVRRHYDLLAV